MLVRILFISMLLFGVTAGVLIHYEYRDLGLLCLCLASTSLAQCIGLRVIKLQEDKNKQSDSAEPEEEET